MLPSLLVCGCGASYEAYVSGTVTLDQQPLTTGTITFQPVGPGPITTGAVQQNGAYRLQTGAMRGLACGEYRVTVQAFSATPAPGMTKEQLAAISLVPLHYAKPDASGLRYTVEPGSQQIDIELHSGGE